MNIDLTPEQQKAIEGLAAQNGTSPDVELRRIVEDALERNQNYDRWFREKVQEGRAAALRGEFFEHEEVGRILDKRYPF